MSKPKPKKQERVAEKLAQKLELDKYRFVQAQLAILRDGNLCVFHWFLHGKKVRRDDLHHVYSRGKEAGDWRENHKNLLCTCRECHPLPIQTPGGNPELAYVEEVLRMANDTPINPRFRGAK